MIEVGIIDYGAGNIASVQHSIEYAGYDQTRICNPEQVLQCERIVLPGVGAAGPALESIRNSGLLEALHEAVFDKGTPVMGICLGMQLLADRLYEFGEHQGFGWIPGEVVALESVMQDSRHIPHMGWNTVDFISDGRKFSHRLGCRKEFYFAHSYTFRVANDNHIAATFDYPNSLVAAVLYDNIFAVQFHPEKSQISGENIIQSFLEWTP